MITLNADEQKVWREAVTAYARGLSKSDHVSSDNLVALDGRDGRIGRCAEVGKPSAGDRLGRSRNPEPRGADLPESVVAGAASG